MTEKQCKYLKKNGELCNAMPVKKSDYCFSHNPDTKKEKHLAVTKGGLAPKRVKLDLPTVQIKNADDVIDVLEETINAVRGGSMPCSNPANTIGFLCSHILKAIELAKYADKIETVERILFERKITK